MSTEDLGEIPITGCDEANIPVCCFLHAPGESDEHPDKWSWTASNYMPRRGHLMSDAYKLVSDSRVEILALIQMHVVPLYRIALEEVATGNLYYWQRG